MHGERLEMIDQFEVITTAALGDLVLLQHGVGQVESLDVTVAAEQTIVVHRRHVDRVLKRGLRSLHLLGQVDAEHFLVLEQGDVVRLVLDYRLLLAHDVLNTLHAILVLGALAVQRSIRHVR